MPQFTKRQQEIINTSIELISENGIQELTIKNLSKNIGIAESAIYRHFDSKFDILLGILSQFKDSKTAALSHIQDSDVSEIKQLEMVFSQRLKQFTQTPAITAVIFSEEIFQNDKRLSDEVFDIMNKSQKFVFSFIENGQKNGAIRDDISAEQLSFTIIGALRFVVTKWRLSGFSFNLEEEGIELWKSLKKMIEV